MAPAMSLQATRSASMAGSTRLRSGLSKGLPRPTAGRRSAIKPRALMEGVEHLHAAAAHLSALPPLHDAAHHAAQALYALADAGDAATDAAAAVAAAATDAAAATATDAAAAAAANNGGVFGFLADGFEQVLEGIESVLDRAGVPYAYGFSIILLTVLVKGATFPLSKKSMESTMAMQALQPRIKELQAKYAADAETLQLETARLYRDAGVNPLAGCLPTLATIPVFIGLYRALTKAADGGLLTDGFFWIPSLAGPSSLTARQAGAGLAWLFPLQDGAPPVGWHDAVAYLVLPVLLIVSQYISQKLVSPQSQDPSQAQTQAVLKFIPLMIGWFSLNVPSGLTLYWFVNNVLSTAQQVYMKQTIKVNVPAPAGAAAGGGGQSGPVVNATIVKPKEERGGGKASGRELGSRKKKPRDGGGESSDDEGASSSAAAAAPSTSSGGGGGGGGGRGQKFRANKALEAAGKAASIAASGSGGGGGGAAAAGERFAAQKAAEAAPTATAEGGLRVPDAPPSKD